MTDPAKRLKAWFKDRFERESFRLSMGEIRVDVAGLNTLVGFLAQGVALAAYGEERYFTQLAKVHEKLSGMIEDMNLDPNGQRSSVYHYSLLIGALTEAALCAVVQLKEEDHGD